MSERCHLVKSQGAADMGSAEWIRTSSETRVRVSEELCFLKFASPLSLLLLVFLWAFPVLLARCIDWDKRVTFQHIQVRRDHGYEVMKFKLRL